MELETLQILWYLVLGAAVMMYTVLDGFDLGVGVLHLFARTDQERRIFLNAIGPVWDGNEVWLIIIGGALFAGFPTAFGIVFSAFYTPTMVFLSGIIFRAVAIEFRSKHPGRKWRLGWDLVFSLASIVIACGAGILLACLMRGIPLNEEGVFIGGVSDFVSFYSVLVGLMTIALFALHGLCFLLMKTEDSLYHFLRSLVKPVVLIFAVLYCVTTIDTIIHLPHMIERFQSSPILYLIPLSTFLALVNIPYQIHRNREGMAFIFSSLSIALLFVLFGVGMFPVIVRSSIDPAFHVTLYNSSSMATTLKVILITALVGIPLVLAYGIFLYRIFRGKVKIDASSY